jgi:hypothetical protein
MGEAIKMEIIEANKTRILQKKKKKRKSFRKKTRLKDF